MKDIRNVIWDLYYLLDDYWYKMIPRYFNLWSNDGVIFREMEYIIGKIKF